MSTTVRGVFCALIILVLAGCGGDQRVAPELSAPPTRTPVVPTASAPDAAVHLTVPDNVRVVSLRTAINTYLTDAATVGALDWVDVFTRDVITPNQSCFVGSLSPDTQPLELLAQFHLNLPSINAEDWQPAVDDFPEDDLIARTDDAISQAAALLPMDDPLTFCMMPAPVFHGYGFEGGEIPGGGLLSSGQGDAVLMACFGDLQPCLDGWAAQTAYEYAAAYQFIQGGRGGNEIPLLDYVIIFGRASDFARQLYPDAAFRWDNALTPDQEVDVWGRMQEYLQTTYDDYPGYRNVDYFLYGGDNQKRYPAWAGFYIGERIVQAYRAAHPDVTLVELMALNPADVVAGSGYAPQSLTPQATAATGG